jgi:Flp pilus assembly protein TadG
MARRLIANVRGATAVQTAIVLPILLLLIFGVIETAYLMFAQISLDYAVAAAARCAAVNTNLCGSQSAIQSYAVGRVVAFPNLTTSSFPTPTACPTQPSSTSYSKVTATYAIKSLVGHYIPYLSTMTLQGVAQYPCA